jgi:hypothetical protein
MRGTVLVWLIALVAQARDQRCPSKELERTLPPRRLREPGSIAFEMDSRPSAGSGQAFAGTTGASESLQFQMTLALDSSNSRRRRSSGYILPGLCLVRDEPLPVMGLAEMPAKRLHQVGRGKP